MAEGEINIDNIIQRLLEGECHPVWWVWGGGGVSCWTERQILGGKNRKWGMGQEQMVKPHSIHPYLGQLNFEDTVVDWFFGIYGGRDLFSHTVTNVMVKKVYCEQMIQKLNHTKNTTINGIITHKGG